MLEMPCAWTMNILFYGPRLNHITVSSGYMTKPTGQKGVGVLFTDGFDTGNITGIDVRNKTRLGVS